MIHEVSGDILLSKAQAIAHGVAPDDHFNTGLALSLREQWPSLAKDFRHYCHTAHPKEGEVFAWVSSDGRRIFNLLTQESAEGHKSGHVHPGPAHIEHVNHALKALARVVQEEKITSLSLPRLGTGVGGLDWAKVSPLVQEHLGSLGIPVYVYTTYQKGVQATEK